MTAYTTSSLRTFRAICLTSRWCSFSARAGSSASCGGRGRCSVVGRSRTKMTQAGYGGERGWTSYRWVHSPWVIPPHRRCADHTPSQSPPPRLTGGAQTTLQARARPLASPVVRRPLFMPEPVPWLARSGWHVRRQAGLARPESASRRGEGENKVYACGGEREAMEAASSFIILESCRLTPLFPSPLPHL